VDRAGVAKRDIFAMFETVEMRNLKHLKIREKEPPEHLKMWEIR
jgi:hypothetical protein